MTDPAAEETLMRRNFTLAQSALDGMSPPSEYIVFRRTPPRQFGDADWPNEDRWEGWWYRRVDVEGPAAPIPPGTAGVWEYATATASGRFERRDDGALAEVYEVRLKAGVTS